MVRERGEAVVVARKRTSRTLVVALQLGFFALSMGGWELLSRANWLDPFFFSMPSEIGRRMAEWMWSGYIWNHLATTLTEAMAAFAIGIVAGVAAGLALARIPLLAAVFDPYIRVMNALPRVILAPILI
ncbi:MAG: ABC transporter permease, partial [Alphaproteobacteria bacterium]